MENFQIKNSQTPMMKSTDFKSRIDAMMEAQQRAEISRAVTTLQSYQNFRANGEKHFKEKLVEEELRQEVNKPLEDALLEIKTLRSTLVRRDEWLARLRKWENYNAESASASTHHMSTIAVEETTELASLKDTLARMEQALDFVAAENETLKRKLDTQFELRKDHFLELERKSLELSECIRHFTREKEGLHQAWVQKDLALERMAVAHEHALAESSRFENRIVELELLECSLRDKLRVMSAECAEHFSEASHLRALTLSQHDLMRAAKERIIEIVAENEELKKK
jgi:hypothetical protein